MLSIYLLRHPEPVPICHHHLHWDPCHHHAGNFTVTSSTDLIVSLSLPIPSWETLSHGYPSRNHPTRRESTPSWFPAPLTSAVPIILLRWSWVAASARGPGETGALWWFISKKERAPRKRNVQVPRAAAVAVADSVQGRTYSCPPLTGLAGQGGCVCGSI